MLKCPMVSISEKLRPPAGLFLLLVHHLSSSCRKLTIEQLIRNPQRIVQ